MIFYYVYNYLNDECFVDLAVFSEASYSLLIFAEFKFNCCTTLFSVCKQSFRYIISEFMLMNFQIYNKKNSKVRNFTCSEKMLKQKKLVKLTLGF